MSARNFRVVFYLKTKRITLFPGGVHVLNSTTALIAVHLLLSSSSIHAHALQDDCQELSAWDCGSGARLEMPVRLDDVVAIDAGDIFSVALRANGQIVVWGTAPNDPIG